MLGRFKFKVGQRVRLSARGKEQFLLPMTKHDIGGTVIKVDEFNCPTVRWDHRRTASSYHPDFIERDYRHTPSRSGG